MRTKFKSDFHFFWPLVNCDCPSIFAFGNFTTFLFLYDQPIIWWIYSWIWTTEYVFKRFCYDFMRFKLISTNTSTFAYYIEFIINFFPTHLEDDSIKFDLIFRLCLTLIYSLTIGESFFPRCSATVELQENTEWIQISLRG